ncbi:MAG: hypothetical protein M0P47_03010 [Bacteroidales bacterium]|nr:hypothetical protein [Bacteroidales bacterium]
MFIKFFKSSFFTQYLVITVIGILLWTNAFINPPEMPMPDGPVPLYEMVYKWLHDLPFVSTLLAFLLVCGETYGLTLILNKHELIQKNSSLSALIFLVLMSILPEMLTLNPINICIFFMILMIHHLLILYNKPEHLDRAFGLGFFTALAGMFYIPFLLWFGLIIIGFILYSSGHWREWVAALIGLVTPFLYLSVFYFWNDELFVKAFEYPDFFRHILFFPNPFSLDFWVLGGIIILVSLWGIYRIWMGPIEKTVELRVKSSIFLWMLIFTIATAVYSRSLAIYHPLLAAPSFTMIISSLLFGLRKKKLVEIVLLIFFLMVLTNNLVLHPLLTLGK